MRTPAGFTPLSALLLSSCFCWDVACSGWGVGSVEAQVRAFYARHNPDKVSQVPKILRRYKGRELKLLADLEEKYGSDDGGALAVESQLGQQQEKQEEPSSCDVKSPHHTRGSGLHWLWGAPTVLLRLVAAVA